MAIREVTMYRKDDDGDIVALCNPDALWSPRLKGDAINDIENNIHTYYVLCEGRRVDITVFKDKDGRSLVTDSMKTVKNNLVNLQDY